MTDRRVKVSLALLVSTLAVTSQLGRADAGVQTHLGSVALQGASMDNMMGLGNVSQCVLLFGAYCNGNMGDVIQASAMARLVADVSSDAQCVWHAHPSKEDSVNGFHEGTPVLVHTLCCTTQTRSCTLSKVEGSSCFQSVTPRFVEYATERGKPPHTKCAVYRLQEHSGKRFEPLPSLCPPFSFAKEGFGVPSPHEYTGCSILSNEAHYTAAVPDVQCSAVLSCTVLYCYEYDKTA